MPRDSEKGFLEVAFFITICALLGVIENSFFFYMSLLGQAPNLILSFLLVNIYFKKESYLVSLFRAGVAAFFISMFTGTAWFFVGAAVWLAMTLAMSLAGVIREENLFIFCLISLASLLFYYQLLAGLTPLLKEASPRLIGGDEVVSAVYTLIFSILFYLLYGRFSKIKRAWSK